MKGDEELLKEIEDILKEQSYTDNSEVIKKSNKEKIIVNLMLIAIVVIMIVAFLYEMLIENQHNEISAEEEQKYEEYYENYSDEYDSYYEYEESIKEKEYKALTQNISVNSYVVRDKIICELFNSNDKDVNDIDIYIIYYDSEKKPVNIDNNNIYLIHAQNNSYCEFKIKENYATYDLLLIKEYDGSKVAIPLENIELTTNEDFDKDKISVDVKNNSDKKIDTIELCMICYDNEGEISSIETRSGFDIGVNKSEEIVFYIYDEQMDNYEIIVNYACKYKE